ncbi:MAG: M16 family metallopeptidase [Candidatus Bathyarchaeia archaeon]
MELRVIGEKGKALARVKIGVRSGWRHEVDGKRGISHFLEHAIFSGNRSYPLPDTEALKYGVTINGMTNPELTLFYFISAKEDVDKILSLFLSLIFHPEFNEHNLQRIRDEEIITAVVQEGDYTPWKLAEEWAGNLVFEWDFRSSLGVEKDISKLGKGELTEWHRKYYHASNSFITVYGDISEDETEGVIENAGIPLKGETPSPFRIKWNTKEISIRKEGTRNVEMVYGFRIAQHNATWEILRILGNYPLFKLWDDSLKKFSFTVNSQLKWTTTEGGFFICFGATSKENAEKIDRNLIPMLGNLELSENDLELAKKIRTVEILKRKDEGGLTDRNFQETLDKIKEVNREQILSIADRFLNEKNAVRVSVGNVK